MNQQQEKLQIISEQVSEEQNDDQTSKSSKKDFGKTIEKKRKTYLRRKPDLLVQENKDDLFEEKINNLVLVQKDKRKKLKNKIKNIESNLELFKQNIQIELEKTFNEKINIHNKKVDILQKVDEIKIDQKPQKKTLKQLIEEY